MCWKKWFLWLAWNRWHLTSQTSRGRRWSFCRSHLLTSLGFIQTSNFLNFLKYLLTWSLHWKNLHNIYKTIQILKHYSSRKTCTTMKISRNWCCQSRLEYWRSACTFKTSQYSLSKFTILKFKKIRERSLLAFRTKKFNRIWQAPLFIRSICTLTT